MVSIQHFLACKVNMSIMTQSVELSLPTSKVHGSNLISDIIEYYPTNYELEMTKMNY